MMLTMTTPLEVCELSRPERREARRVAFDLAVECEVSGEKVLDYLSNVSVGGAAIHASRLRAPTGAPIVLRFRIPGTAVRTDLPGWVVRTDVNEDGATVAVRFGALDERTTRALEAL